MADSPKMPTRPDVFVADHGFLCIITAVSEDAKRWIRESYRANDPARTSTGVSIGLRYLPPVLRDIEASGLSYEFYDV